MADPAPASPKQNSSVRTWLLLAASAAGLLFILINSRSVKINFIFGSVQMSLFFALALSMVLGVIIGYLLAKFRERD